jgi:hypothetical protein
MLIKPWETIIVTASFFLVIGNLRDNIDNYLFPMCDVNDVTFLVTQKHDKGNYHEGKHYF